MINIKGLRAIRKKRGLTLQQLGDLTGIDFNSISRYERGVLVPNVRTIEKIASALNVTTDELLNGPKDEKIKIEVIFDREIWEEASIDMTGNLFSLLFEGNGVIGIKGASGFKSKEDIAEFLAKAKKELEDAFDYQVSRGAIPAGN